MGALLLNIKKKRRITLDIKVKNDCVTEGDERADFIYRRGKAINKYFRYQKDVQVRFILELCALVYHIVCGLLVANWLRVAKRSSV